VNLEVSYDKEFDILRMLIPGRRIATSGRVSPPLIIDFGSEEDGFDVVGFEFSHASEHLAPFLKALTERSTSVESV
jgi:uncharacterized protein YuzE